MNRLAYARLAINEGNALIIGWIGIDCRPILDMDGEMDRIAVTHIVDMLIGGNALERATTRRYYA